jgi:hypothetical protein
MLASPQISGVFGEFVEGAVVRLTGAGFDDVAAPGPVAWSSFATGAATPDILRQGVSWNLHNMQASPTGGVNGSGGAVATDGSGKWGIEVVSDGWTSPGQSFYIFRKVKRNFVVPHNSPDPDVNYKSYRLWLQPDGRGYPNLYAAPSNGRVFVENPATGKETGFWGYFPLAKADWQTEEIQFIASSGVGVKDGKFLLTYDNRAAAGGDVGETIMTSPGGPDTMRSNFVVHEVAANTGSWSNPSWSTNNRVWVDDVYVQYGLARVLSGDAPRYSDCKELEIQIPTGSWSDRELTIRSHTAAVGSGSRRWLYVFDSSGRFNEVGYPIWVGMPLPGDADLDGSVNRKDLSILLRNFNKTGDWSRGDFDRDGWVTFKDFQILERGFGRTPTLGGSAVASTSSLDRRPETADGTRPLGVAVRPVPTAKPFRTARIKLRELFE